MEAFNSSVYFIMSGVFLISFMLGLCLFYSNFISLKVSAITSFIILTTLMSYYWIIEMKLLTLEENITALFPLIVITLTLLTMKKFSKKVRKFRMPPTQGVAYLFSHSLIRTVVGVAFSYAYFYWAIQLTTTFG